eukprot:scaffold37690_cov128-Skeletonema_marinoi.AAC.12
MEITSTQAKYNDIEIGNPQPGRPPWHRQAGHANHVESWLGLIYSATKAVRVSIPAFIQALRVCLLHMYILGIAFDGDND